MFFKTNWKSTENVQCIELPQMAPCDMPSDAERIRRVKLLIENGFLSKVTISHDIHTKHRLKVNARMSEKCRFNFKVTHGQGPNMPPRRRRERKGGKKRNGCAYDCQCPLVLRYKYLIQAFGGHGYTHILENVVPMMQSRGITKEQVDTILMDNPKAWLTYWPRVCSNFDVNLYIPFSSWRWIIAVFWFDYKISAVIDSRTSVQSMDVVGMYALLYWGIILVLVLDH